jgi:hypothetical protein
VNLTVSQPIRILALVGVLAIAALGGTTMLLGRSHSATATKGPAQARVQHVPAAPAPAAHTPAMHAEPTAPAKPTVTPARPAKTEGATKHKTAKPAAPKHRGNLVYADLPAPLQWQLSQHKIVVVSLYNPNSNVDAISVAEAHQGAVDAGAGFLLVSVLDDKIAGILTALLPGGGLLPAPGILVYRAPGNIALRIDGFADRATVAQAAQNARTGENGPAPAAPAAVAPLAVPPATVTP